MSTRAVIGMGFGDEGKGVTTEYLCSQDPSNTIVIRFSGGPQAGHKVIKGDVEHVFSSFGAGTLSGCPTYWSKRCTVDPVAFLNELALLRTKGIRPKIYMHPKCPVTTIYDVFAGRQGKEVEHGTTGTGFFRTRKREVDGLHFTADMLFRSFNTKIHDTLKEIKNYYGIKEELNEDLFLDARKVMVKLLEKYVVLSDQIPDYEHKVFEGSQGLMLDEHIGYMPHCTPSDVTPKAILDMGHSLDEVFLVTRAYQTRHGNGPMTNEKYGVELKNNEKETNVSHQYQGKFRTSILDLDQLLHAKTKGIDEVVSKNTKVNLVVTCLDQLSDYYLSYKKYGEDGIRVCTNSEIFVKLIASYLNIKGDVYINDSPYSTSIKKIWSETNG